jgi:hypothetical protein
MKNRIKEIIETLKKVRAEESLIVSDERLFKEALTCYRGEMTGKPKGEKEDKRKSKQATDKQIAYVQQLADKKGIEIRITGKETSYQISKLIEELK